jgi:hypothetical protein
MKAFAVRETDKGKAVFTEKNLAQGELITEWTGVRISAAELPHPYQSAHDVYTQIGPATFMGPSGSIDDLINHSCDPNCGLYFEGDHIYCRTIRSVAEGEELTWDYATTMNGKGIHELDDWSMKCACGSPRCRGIISSFDKVPKTVQDEYIRLGIVPDYVLAGDLQSNR